MNKTIEHIPKAKQEELSRITKEDLEATLRTHQAAVDAMKSEQRDAAEADASSDE